LKAKDFSDYALTVGTLEVQGELVGAGVTKIITDGETAQHIASTVSADYNQLITDIAADSTVSIVEKPALKSRWDEIVVEYPLVKSNAVTAGISATGTEYLAYVAAYEALDTYLNTTLAIFADMAVSTTINASTFATKFSDYYTGRSNLTGVAASTTILTPKYKGRVTYASLAGTSGNEYDTILAYSATASECGIYKRTEGAWVRQDGSDGSHPVPTSEMIANAWPDIVWACNQSPSYPTTTPTDYTASEKVQYYTTTNLNYIEMLGANVAFINRLFAQYIRLQADGAIYSGGYNELGDNDGTAGLFLGGDGSVQGNKAVFNEARALEFTGKSMETDGTYDGAWTLGTWGSVAAANAADSQTKATLLLNNDTLLCVYKRASDGYLVQRIRDTDGTWGAESAVVGASIAGQPALSLFSDGRILCTYLSSVLYPTQIIRSTVGTWGSPSTITATQCYDVYSTVHADQTASLLYARSSVNQHIYEMVRGTDGTWGSASEIVTTETGSLTIVELPNGTSLCVYENTDDSQHLYEIVRAAAGTWGSPVEKTAYGATIPSATVLPDSTSMIALRLSASPYSISYLTRSAAGSWSAPADITTTADTFPALAVLADDTVICLYSRVTDYYLYETINNASVSFPIGEISTEVGSGITTSGQNANGNYIKFGDGTMICWKTVSFDTAISSAIGSIYYSGGTTSMGNWAANFIATPTVSTSLSDRTSTVAWLIAQDGATTSSAGTIELASYESKSSTTYAVAIIGIGRWK